MSRDSGSASRPRSSRDGAARRLSTNEHGSGDTGQHKSSGAVRYQRFILTDPVALRYLEDDPCVTILERHWELTGHVSYIVEQWAVSRAHPIFTVTVHSGDHDDKVCCSVLGIPTDEEQWSAKLQAYLRAMNRLHARRQDTPIGITMVTSLSELPSTLSVVQVPEGDISRHLADFFVNVNLRRLGCSGRVGLALSYPSSATVVKFYQLYKTSEKIALYTSVIELVRMVQTALHLFGMLESEYIDGLICDVTDKAVLRWWTELGIDLYPTEPHDGILGPSTVAALIGTLMGARKRLRAIGVPVGKDVFELDTTKKAISHFQKTQKLDKTRRLDVETHKRLHKLTARAASSERIRLPKAVKATIAEISGRGEELFQEGATMSVKPGVAAVETTDMETFVRLVSGARAKLLWQGRPPRHATTTRRLEFGPEHVFGPATTDKLGDTEGSARSNMHARVPLDEGRRNGQMPDISKTELDIPKTRILPRTDTNKQRAHGVSDEGRTGISRLKDAVSSLKKTPVEGERGPAAPSDKAGWLAQSKSGDSNHGHSLIIPLHSPSGPDPRSTSSDLESTRHGGIHWRRQHKHHGRHTTEDDAQTRDASPEHWRHHHDGRDEHTIGDDSQTHAASQKLQTMLSDPPTNNVDRTGVDTDMRPQIETIPSSALYHGVNLEQLLPGPLQGSMDMPRTLRRTLSDNFEDVRRSYSHARPLRHLSFSLAESSMFRSVGAEPPSQPGLEDHLERRYIEQRFFELSMRSVRSSISQLAIRDAQWASERVDGVEGLVQQARRDEEQLKPSQGDSDAAIDKLSEVSKATLHDEHDMLDNRTRELETLAARLDYDVANLQGKVKDVELGVDEFVRAVDMAERRAIEVEKEMAAGREWSSCVMS